MGAARVQSVQSTRAVFKVCDECLLFAQVSHPMRGHMVLLHDMRAYNTKASSALSKHLREFYDSANKRERSSISPLGRSQLLNVLF